jgi:hypothetical protein
VIYLKHPSIDPEPAFVVNAATARAVVDRIRDETRGQIRDLEADCDGEVLTVRGEVDNLYFRQMAFIAAWIAARSAGGLLFDLKVDVVTPTGGEHL